MAANVQRQSYNKEEERLEERVEWNMRGDQQGKYK